MEEIKITKATHSKLPEIDWETLKFGQHTADHMFMADWENGLWHNPVILPYHDIPLNPAISALHYGQAIFEGLKAYRSKDGSVKIFRPNANYDRMKVSAKRLAMPEIPENIFMDGLKKLIDLDRSWVPSIEGSSLYIRPFMFATDTFIGIRPSTKFKFMIITTPVVKYYAEPPRVLIEEYYTRAEDGGVGFTKAAGNYGRSLYPAKMGQDKGYHQLIWTDSKEHKFIEESGTMNVMFIIDDTLITPAISTTILAGVTRDSVLTIAKDLGVRVEERRVSVEEIINASKDGRLQDAFGTGTAATIAQFELIGFRGENFVLPPIETRSITNKIKSILNSIRYGELVDKYNWMYQI
jgi:branched-chain amino acid aminotransferase